MSPKTKYTSVLLSIGFVLLSSFFAFPSIPVAQAKGDAPVAVQDFEQFARSVYDGEAGMVRGVYIPELLAAKVLQQPGNKDDYVSPVNGVVTEYSKVRPFGNIGLLAHNYLAGGSFSRIALGQEIRIVYGDGNVEYFVVKEILQYQALEPNNPGGDLVDLDSGERRSSSSVFNRVYTGKRHITLQTCIYANKNLSWGRLFVIAVPDTKTK